MYCNWQTEYGEKTLITYSILLQKRAITPIDEYKYPALAYTQQVNSVFCALWLVH